MQIFCFYFYIRFAFRIKMNRYVYIDIINCKPKPELSPEIVSHKNK